jgi:hypothetical protein
MKRSPARAFHGARARGVLLRAARRPVPAPQLSPATSAADAQSCPCGRRHGPPLCRLCRDNPVSPAFHLYLPPPTRDRANGAASQSPPCTCARVPDVYPQHTQTHAIIRAANEDAPTVRRTSRPPTLRHASPPVFVCASFYYTPWEKLRTRCGSIATTPRHSRRAPRPRAHGPEGWRGPSGILAANGNDYARLCSGANCASRTLLLFLSGSWPPL